MTKFRRRTQLGLPVPQPVLTEVKTYTIRDVQPAAREKTDAAITVLAAIMYKETANAFARVAAAKEILDRGWGKAVQPLSTEAVPADLVQKIERVIVHPRQAGEALPIEGPSSVAGRSQD